METFCVGKVVQVILFTDLFVSFWGFWVCLRMQLLFTYKYFLSFTGNAPLIFCFESLFCFEIMVGELAGLGGLAGLGEMIFIPRSYGIFYLSSIKKFVMSLEKDCWIK